MPQDQPTLVLLLLTVDDVVARLQARRARERTRELGRRGHWTAVATPGGVQLDLLEWELVVAMTRASSPSELVARTGGAPPDGQCGPVPAGRGAYGAGVDAGSAGPAGSVNPCGGSGAVPANGTVGGSPTPPATRAASGGTVPTTRGRSREEPSGRAGALRRLIGAVRAG